VPDVIGKLLGEWQKKSPALARAFDFDLSSLDRAKYPVRETLLQFHESDDVSATSSAVAEWTARRRPARMCLAADHHE
jgi:hypothetical protein